MIVWRDTMAIVFDEGFKYKWQEDFADEIECLTFGEKIDELVNIAQLGDRMEKRDEWKLDYLTRHIKENHGI